MLCVVCTDFSCSLYRPSYTILCQTKGISLLCRSHRSKPLPITHHPAISHSSRLSGLYIFIIFFPSNVTYYVTCFCLALPLPLPQTATATRYLLTFFFLLCITFCFFLLLLECCFWALTRLHGRSMLSPSAGDTWKFEEREIENWGVFCLACVRWPTTHKWEVRSERHGLKAIERHMETKRSSSKKRVHIYNQKDKEKKKASRWKEDMPAGCIPKLSIPPLLYFIPFFFINYYFLHISSLLS